MYTLPPPLGVSVSSFSPSTLTLRPYSRNLFSNNTIFIQASRLSSRTRGVIQFANSLESGEEKDEEEERERGEGKEARVRHGLATKL